MSVKTFNCKNLKELAETITSQNIFGLVVDHPTEGRAVILHYQKESGIFNVFYENQKPGFNGFRNLMYRLDEYEIVKDFNYEKAASAMMSFLIS